MKPLNSYKQKSRRPGGQKALLQPTGAPEVRVACSKPNSRTHPPDTRKYNTMPFRRRARKKRKRRRDREGEKEKKIKRRREREEEKEKKRRRRRERKEEKEKNK